MANVIKIKYSDTAGATPTLDTGEIAFNRVDNKLFYTDNLNVVQSFSLGVSTANLPLINAASSLIQTQNIITQMLINQK